MLELKAIKYIFFFWEWTFILIILKIILILISVAYFTIAERKAMASIQRRRGPNVVGLFGLLQPLADGLKLLCKKLILPTNSNAKLFLLSPAIILALSLIGWNVIPFGILMVDEQFLNINFINGYYINLSYSNRFEYFKYLLDTQKGVAQIHYTIFFLLGISSLNVYAIIIAGWSSNSKYAFLGSLRSAAQMISYEISIGLVLLPIVLLSKTFNLTEIVVSQKFTGWFCFPLLPCVIIFFISMLAETNRTPFDLPEAEAELVAGYNVEYSSLIFSMFFLGEYSNMLIMSTLISILFFGGWLPPFNFLSVINEPIFLCLKLTFFCFIFILVRATLPRYKYNQLMDIGWKIFLPISLSFFLFLSSILFYSNILT